jgi:hypothetical protein
MENPNFLKQKYNLHSSEEVEKAALRTEQKTGEKVPQNPDAQIQNYLDRLECLALDPEKEQSKKTLNNESRPRALSLLREMLMNKYVRPNKEKMAEGAARVEERAARERGIEAHYGEEELEQRGEIAVADLEKSLDNWIMYLSDQNEPYPTWFRYYAFRNVLDMGDFDKDKGEFTKRSQGSTKLFPDIDRGALAFVEERIEAAKDPAALEKIQRAQKATETPADQILTKAQADAFAKMSFSKQYTEGIKQNGEITPEMREITEGKWVKYQQGTDPTSLWASLQNKGTAWCTKGFGTAETQLNGGDFYVYYTNDKTGKAAIPRIAIRMQEDGIGEVRGVADNQQNLEGNMTEIAEAKMNELPGAESYRKKSGDMKQLTAIEKKVNQGQNLNRNELVFLYQINSKIEGFGYKDDPRIQEIILTRKLKEDAPIVLECEPEEIAYGQEEYDKAVKDNKTIKAYIGPLFPQVFSQNLEHIYTSFPNGRTEKAEVNIGNKTKEDLIKELEEREKSTNPEDKIYIYSGAKSMLQKPEFAVISKPEKRNLIKLKVQDLGFEKNPTTEQIYKRAEELGLELCPPEIGPHLRLNYQEIFKREQAKGEWLRIGMKQITDSNGYPKVFCVYRNDDGERWLVIYWAKPENEWTLESEFVFDPQVDA